MMGVTAMLYFAGAMIAHKQWPVAFTAAMLMFVGMAHGTSAMILRWRAQGLVACVWWVGGVAMFFICDHYWLQIFVGEMCFGMIGFGLYAMWLERRMSVAKCKENEDDTYGAGRWDDGRSWCSAWR